MDRSRGGTHRTPWTAVAAELTEWWLNEQQNVSSNYAQKTRMLHNAMLARLSHDIYNVVCDASAHLMQETPTILYMLQQSWRNEWMNECMNERMLTFAWKFPLGILTEYFTKLWICENAYLIFGLNVCPGGKRRGWGSFPTKQTIFSHLHPSRTHN